MAVNHKIKFLEKFRQYRFELKHLLVLLVVLIFFLLLVSFIHKTSLEGLLIKTQEWYQQDSAERLANLTATSLELLMETTGKRGNQTEHETEKIIKAFNIILNQQKLQKNVEDICVLISNNNQIYAIDDGATLYSYFINNQSASLKKDTTHLKAIHLYEVELHEKMRMREQIYSIPEGDQIFHVFVPFVPKGEYAGAVYVKNQPDFSFITREIISSYDETAILFAALIILGLLAMFYISSYTVKERDETQQLLFNEREKYLLDKIEREKEVLFTKRIYHTHHKAEKVMGFIKEDLRSISDKNIEEIKHRVINYANFISRVIYDMKWYDPPLQTIRNPIFNTNLNEVIRFIVKYIFLRTSQNVKYEFDLDLDDRLPVVSINEFVVWEILEPLIQNCVEHAGQNIIIIIKTQYDPQTGNSTIIIEDNGSGFDPALLEAGENGIKKLFLENISTKKVTENSGYGCYIAFEISRRRCHWDLDAENKPDGGGRYILKIKN